MINQNQIRKLVIVPALDAIGMGGEDAVELVFNTGLVESHYKYISQVGGPALSFWQVEPSTAYDHYENYLGYRAELSQRIENATGCNESDIEWNLTTNLAFDCIMARIKYRRSPLPLPKFDDIEGQAFIWKKVYNTPEGKGTEQKFIQMVNDFNFMG